jgi:hypothetical protein
MNNDYKMEYAILDKGLELGKLVGDLAGDCCELRFARGKRYDVNKYKINVVDVVEKGEECGLWWVDWHKNLMVKDGSVSKWTEFLDDVMFEYAVID